MKTKTEEKISLFCEIRRGSPPFKIEWTKNGNDIQSDEHTKIQRVEEDSVLIIKSSKESDAGNYTCTVKNSFGSDSSTTQLVIQGKATETCLGDQLILSKQLRHQSSSQMDPKTVGFTHGTRIVGSSHLFSFGTAQSNGHMEETRRYYMNSTA